MSGKAKLIVALDVQTMDEANRLVEQLKDVVDMFKIGSQLFTTAGPGLVRSIIAGGNQVFLDLKYHDIPHQIAGAARVAAELGVSLFTVHASGGAEMMRSAVEAVSIQAETTGIRSKILAVSVLTSMDATALAQIGMRDTAAHAVERLVKLAEEVGIDGCVSSPLETAAIRSYTKPGFLIVNPGIRPASSEHSAHEDQKRVATAASAIKAGADYLVVGRPITSASDPVAAANEFVEEIENAMESKGERSNASNV